MHSSQRRTPIANPRYRLILGSRLVGGVGFALGQAVAIWLVESRTGSGALAGLAVAAAWAPAFGLALLGGHLADRFDKRWLVAGANLGAAIPALALGLATLSGVLAAWMLPVFTLLRAGARIIVEWRLGRSRAPSGAPRAHSSWRLDSPWQRTRSSWAQWTRSHSRSSLCWL